MDLGDLTRDLDQGLDFLDLILSASRLLYDISRQLGPGGDFECAYQSSKNFKNSGSEQEI